MSLYSKFLEALFGRFLAFLSLFVAKDESIWVFGAWFGHRYSDNSRYFYEWININKPEITSIWITKTKKLIYDVPSDMKVYYYLSLLGIYYILKARVTVYVINDSDILRGSVTSKSLRVNLWHGIPLKKIHADAIASMSSVSHRFMKSIHHKFIRNDIIISSSSFVQNLFASAFRKNHEDIIITGFPRTDILFKNTRKGKSCESKNILYTPTYRQGKKESFDLHGLNFELLENINNVLCLNNAFLTIRPHYFHRNEFKQILCQYSNIGLDVSDSIEHAYEAADFLITDYSSCMFDYLCLDRPIIFFPYDLEEYQEKERNFYFDYNEIVVGDIFYTWQELIDSFFSVINKYEDNHSEIRNKLKSRLYDHTDAKSCSRLYEAIKSRL